jgi:hypothetical protein
MLTLAILGQLILYQDSSYRNGFRRQYGVMHSEQLIAYIPLNKGENTLRAVVSDRFGGWGLFARKQNCNDIVEKK